MTNEALAPYVTFAILTFLAGWVPLLEAIASAWRKQRGVHHPQPRHEETAPDFTDRSVWEFSA